MRWPVEPGQEAGRLGSLGSALEGELHTGEVDISKTHHPVVTHPPFLSYLLFLNPCF